MLEFTSIAGSDDWWLIRLCNQLGEGLPRMHKITQYRDGNALIPDNMWEGSREGYMRLMRRSRLHVAETIRDARTNRQIVIGFRTGAANDDAGDKAAMKNWKTSNMGVQARPFFNDTADYGSSYILTRQDENNFPLFQTRNGWNTATEPDPSRPWLTRFAVVVTYDAVNQEEIAVLFGQGWYRVAVRRSAFATLPTNGTKWVVNSDWNWAGDRVLTPWTRRNLIVRNQTVDGFGVYEKHLDTIDRINEITLNAITLIITQSFRQRSVIGDLPTHFPEGHPQAGQEIDYDEMFKAGPAALWMLPMNSQIIESAASDVRPIYAARKDEVETLASLTATPQYVFQSDSANQSATGAELAREQLVFAVNAMNDQAEVSLIHSQSTAFEILGDAQRAEVTDLEVIWGKTNPATMAERGEAAPKFKAGGAPQRWIDEHILEMTPAELERAATDRQDDAFLVSLAAPATATAAATVNPGAQGGE
ncbi:hypothetical protein [Microbacterium lacus]|uniref:hypothetical protein n=1 Tax=Microbacterium lacus TaxID=415217 RepID=UPI000C2CBC97|nr:hypothetical protein [Microbacterium lacus]